MAAPAGSDSEEEDLVNYGTALRPLAEGEHIKKPVPLQEQTVRDEKGRYKRFHGAFTGGFSAGYFNTVGSKEGWAPSTFLSSRQKRADKTVFGPEDFMDEEDLSEFGIAPKEITTTDDFASKTKDRIKEKARQIAGIAEPIPGASVLDDLIAPARITIGVELLRKMGWKEGQGVGPRVKRKPNKQQPDPTVKIYGCALPPGASGSEGEEDDYQPENVTFAPRDVMPVQLTLKENVHGLGYKGLDPTMALFGVSGEHINLLDDDFEKSNNLLGDVRNRKGRKLGISGQAFGVGALEDDDDDIYATEKLSKYDTVLKDEEPGDGLYGWTAPNQYKNKKRLEAEVKYIGKILDGFSLASKSAAPSKTYPPPDLPRGYRPVHYFRPVITPSSENSPLLKVLVESTGKLESDTAQQSRHTLNASQRRDMLGETALKGPAPSVLEYLSEKDRERIKEAKQASEQQLKTKPLPQQSIHSRFQSACRESAHQKWQMALREPLATAGSSDFKPFAKNPEKQKRYENYVESLKKGKKADTLVSCLDPSMTEWEQGREQEEFFRAAMFYKSSSSTLSSRFTRAKYEDDTEKVEVPRDQENDIDDKESAVKMKMFGKLTRDKFEWHPEKLLCKRFNVPDPYSDSSIVGLPKVKRDKYSIFNFLTLPETATTTVTQTTNEKVQQTTNPNKPKKPSRWDVSDKEKKKKDSISEFISLARSKVDVQQQQEPATEKDKSRTNEALPNKVINESVDQKEEESRPSMDLFKAVFASSSDEKSSSSEEESDEEEHQTAAAGPDSESTKCADPPDNSSVVQDHAVVTPEPDLPMPSALKEKLDEREFGPRLPPVFSSDTIQQHEPVQLTSFSEVNQKEKRKKNKEKHKTKREHKHKKEKKKKHKKHRHKGKHKNKKSEKNSSSDTAESSDSLSDAEMNVNLSPHELLRRLKDLPITKR